MRSLQVEGAQERGDRITETVGEARQQERRRPTGQGRQQQGGDGDQLHEGVLAGGLLPQGLAVGGVVGRDAAELPGEAHQHGGVTGLQPPGCAGFLAELAVGAGGERGQEQQREQGKHRVAPNASPVLLRWLERSPSATIGALR